MKFAALRQHEVKTLGADALEDSLAYDQKAILETNLDYITKSLGRKGGRDGGRDGGRERGRVWIMLGADALEDSLAYDQKAILETNLDYITKSLG